MVDTMMSQQANGTSNEAEARRIVEGLLRQQPQIVHAAVSGNASSVPHLNEIVEFTSFLKSGLQLQNFITNPSMTPFPFVPLQDPPLIIKEEAPSPSSSSSPSSTATALSIISLPNEPEYKPRNIREKVYADGYIMSFDKKSCCGTKYFWRCERKNDCNARMHSDINTREIVRKLHPHNHEKPTQEELAFYEQDFSQLDPHYCWPVKHVNRSYMQRKLSRASQHTQPSLPDAATDIDSKQLAALQAVLSAAMSPQKNGKKFQISPGNAVRLPRSPKTIKKELEEPTSSTADQMLNKEDYRLTCELTKKLMELMKPKTEIGVTWNGEDGALLLFLSNDSGAEENVFFPVVVRNRDEKSLISAIEGFTGKRCEGKIAMSFSHKVNVLVHEALISNWAHGKLLLVNTDSPALWRLTPVDAYGEVLNSV